jgi:hypothetical protein
LCRATCRPETGPVTEHHARSPGRRTRLPAHGGTGGSTDRAIQPRNRGALERNVSFRLPVSADRAAKDKPHPKRVSSRSSPDAPRRRRCGRHRTESWSDAGENGLRDPGSQEKHRVSHPWLRNRWKATTLTRRRLRHGDGPGRGGPPRRTRGHPGLQRRTRRPARHPMPSRTQHRCGLRGPLWAAGTAAGGRDRCGLRARLRAAAPPTPARD